MIAGQSRKAVQMEEEGKRVGGEEQWEFNWMIVWEKKAIWIFYFTDTVQCTLYSEQNILWGFFKILLIQSKHNIGEVWEEDVEG